jgi:hypothetical protein
MTHSLNPAENDPRALLSQTRALAAQVRRARRGAWFPLLVFATITVAAAPFNRYGPHPRHCAAPTPDTLVCSIAPTLALWYWPIAVLAAYVAIGWFYVHRSRRLGLATTTAPYLGLGALLTVLTAAWAWWADHHPGFLIDTLHLQPGQQSEFLYRIAGPAGAVGLALLLLAWTERSLPLLAVTLVYLAVEVGSAGVNWFHRPTPWAFLPHLLIDAAVLLVGGILLAVTQRADA